MDVCIKNINDEDWLDFKAESVKHGIKIGQFFSTLVQEHEEACKESNWESVLHGEKTCADILSKEEGKILRSLSRKNFGLRNEFHH